jgi:hypothetical protein
MEQRRTPHLFQEGFAVPAKWFHLAGFLAVSPDFWDGWAGARPPNTFFSFSRPA